MNKTYISKDVTLKATSFLINQIPDEDKPEIVIFGRSNVGKSTLINFLFHRKQSNAIAKTSSIPGKTASINFYESSHATLVDLPGYGFTLNRHEKTKWTNLIETYLKNRKTCICCCICIDYRHGLTKRDLAFLDWLHSFNYPIIIVFTKSDKIPKSKRASHTKKIVNECLQFTDQWCVISSKENHTRSELNIFLNNIIDECLNKKTM